MISFSALGNTNNEIVTKFYNEAFINGNINNAVKFLHHSYIQHNPKVKSGKAGFIEVFEDFDPSKYHFEIKRTIAEGELVMLHVHVRNVSKVDNKDLGRAVIDIFRVKGGLITEHWDVSQKIPEITVHKNTMF
jgi:predicted SnoaL-like aldol condensation-catalyzing enzyme